MWAEGHFHIRARCVNFPWITQGITSHAGEGKPPSRETSQLFHFATRSFFPCLCCLLFSLHFHQPGVTWKAAVRNRREAAEAGLPSEDALHECDRVRGVNQVNRAGAFSPLLSAFNRTRRCGATQSHNALFPQAHARPTRSAVDCPRSLYVPRRLWTSDCGTGSHGAPSGKMR